MLNHFFSFQVFDLHSESELRHLKTFYYGGVDACDLPSSDRLSLPLTEVCVDAFTIATAAAQQHSQKCKPC